MENELVNESFFDDYFDNKLMINLVNKVRLIKIDVSICKSIGNILLFKIKNSFCKNLDIFNCVEELLLFCGMMSDEI